MNRRVHGKVSELKVIKLNGMTYLDQGADDAEGRKSEIFERSRFRGSVEEWVQKQWDMG